MSSDLKISVIGLDTSHAIEFTRRLQAPDCPEDQKVAGGHVTRCLRFSTPFQSDEGLDARQKTLEDWGVKVTTSFDEAIEDCDALLVTINDPAAHWDYFQRCAGLGKPVYLDKPLADNIQNGRKIVELVKRNGVRFMSCSSLRFVPNLVDACAVVPQPVLASFFGHMGTAPAGSSIVWYGVHAFEMLQRAMGRGAVKVHTVMSEAGPVVAVEYPGERRGVVELAKSERSYGGSLRDNAKAVPFVADSGRLYSDQLKIVIDFFRGAEPPLTPDDTLEVMAMLDAAARSAESGKTENVF